MTPFGDFLCLLPEIAVAATGCVLLLLIPTRLPRSFLKGLTAAGLIGSAVATVFLWGKSRLLFDGTYALDAYALLFKGIFLLSVAFTLLISASFAKQNPLPEGEYGVLLLFSVLGMMVMAAGLDLAEALRRYPPAVPPPLQVLRGHDDGAVVLSGGEEE